MNLGSLLSPLVHAPIAPAYTPFIDPLNLHALWYLLLLPLALLTAVAYKAVRTRDMSRYPVEVLVMAAQILLGMIALALGFLLFVELLIPLLAPTPRV